MPFRGLATETIFDLMKATTFLSTDIFAHIERSGKEQQTAIFNFHSIGKHNLMSSKSLGAIGQLKAQCLLRQ